MIGVVPVRTRMRLPSHSDGLSAADVVRAVLWGAEMDRPADTFDPVLERSDPQATTDVA
jgi:hypothetical protein